jgi:hypothetical protein
MDKTCTFNTTILPSNAPTFPVQKSNLSLIWEFNSLSGPNNNTEVYDNATQNVLPLVVVTFLPANDSRTTYTTELLSLMTCLRANKSLTGSRVAPPLPAPTTLRKLPIKAKQGSYRRDCYRSCGCCCGDCRVNGMVLSEEEKNEEGK